MKRTIIPTPPKEGEAKPKKAASPSQQLADGIKDLEKKEGFKLENFLFDKQLKFVRDPRPFKVAVCSRRAGKTIACAADLIHNALETAESTCLYITLSRANAKRLIWRELIKINREYKLLGVPDSTELSITFPNGSIIYVSGAKDESEIEKFRGLAFKLVYVDECQSFRPFIKDLIDDVLSAALMDYAGTLCLIGTPGPIPAGYFYDCAEKSDSWSKHSWTFFDNPFITKKSKKTHQELLDRELRRRNVAVTDPSIQREWFGKWVLDSDSLILHYDPTRNDYDELPYKIDQFEFILGIDVGYDDSDAIALLCWNEKSPTTWLVEEKITAKQGITELAGDISYYEQRYKPTKLKMDTGGLGKKIAEELRRRFNIPVEAADKTRKVENLAFLDDALRNGTFKAKRESRFVQDSYLMEKDMAKSTPDKIKISDRYHSDIIDAVLYPFKESPAYTYVKPVDKPKYGSKEWAEQQQNEMWDNAFDHFSKQAAAQRGESEDNY